MATARADEIITDSLNNDISKIIPGNKYDDVFLGLKFNQVHITKMKVQHQLGSDIDGASRHLLNEWVNNNGRKREHAETLKDVMKQCGVSDAAKLIEEAIDNAIEPYDGDASTTTSGIPGSPMDLDYH